jgi:hypothetical protein
MAPVNSFAPIDPKLVDVFPDEHDGYPDHLAAEDTPDVLRDCCGETSREFPKSLYVEPRLWPEMARENDANKTWPINYVDRFTNQNPTHECTWHSGTRVIEGCRNRQRGIIFPDGPKKDFRYEESQQGSVWLSPMSGYNEANPRIRGGASIQSVLRIGCERGVLPDKIQPHDYGFKHTMPGTQGRGNKNQSSGEWVSVANMPEGWRETAKWFKPLEVVVIEDVEQAVSLLLHGYLVGVGRNGHAVPWAQLTFKGNSVSTAPYPDSYDLVRYDSFQTMRSAARGAYAVLSVTAPDDWMKPAG